MTYSDFQYYEAEIKDMINSVLDSAMEKSFSDYVLLIAHGGYSVELENTQLSPYVLSSRLEVYQDRTREQFLVDYLNTYASLLKDRVFITNDYKEYDLNIQMMIYSQIWESHQFLKTLKRIGGILIGNHYEWRISFEIIDSKGKNKPIPKAKMIQDQIIQSIKKGHLGFASFLETIYDSQLRNDFAHASYFISLDEDSIMSLDSERFEVKKQTLLYDWEQMFINSILLSYHLPRIIRERCDRFCEDYPEMQSVSVEIPSCIERGKQIRVQIFPHIREWGVEFGFTKDTKVK